jgi:hypothetical protein
MRETAELISAISKLVWPLLFVSVIWLFRRQIAGIIQPGSDITLAIFGSKFIVKPTRPPRAGQELPPPADRQELPADYLYLNHTSFLRADEELQAEFKRRTGVDLPHYDIRVILASYYEGALERVDRVEYVLHQAYPEPIQVRSNRSTHFLLKELANGEYLILARAYLKGRATPLLLQRYITLWKSGPTVAELTG